MLQILSTSNETSTGAELVQNGNFSEIGSNLVTNGDFSAEGINLVSNPNFTDTGAELITNGDFATDTGWVKEGLWEISGGSANRIAEGVNSRFYQVGVVEALKSYKLTFSISAISAGAINQVTLGGVGISGTWNTAETFTLYFTTVNTASCSITGDATFAGSIDNVSVKELGADWTVVDNDATHYVEFIETGARFVSPTTSPIVQLKQTTFTLLANISYKLTVDMTRVSGGVKFETGGVSETFSATTSGTNNTRYITPTSDVFLTFIRSSSNVDLTFHSISVQELGEGWTLETGWSIGENKAIANTNVNLDMNQDCLATNKNYKVSFDVADLQVGGNFLLSDAAFTDIHNITTNGSKVVYLKTTTNTKLNIRGKGYSFNVTNITAQELDPNGYWTIGTGWSIGANKAISTVTGSSSYLTQAGIVEAGKTYAVGFEVVEYEDGNVKATVSGSEGEARTAKGIYTDTLLATGSSLSIKSQSGSFDGSITAVSGKLLGTYSDQSIYVTAADVQTIAQASVYYLVELTSMGSKNSLYFLPSSVVPNNGRYTKLNFTVISKDALPQPTVGIISFYDSVGGFDTYPMGFYEFRIYEQTSSTNLDPLLATGLLEKGFAFVRDFSGNMQELTDGFKEYNPTLTQYVYSK